MSSTFGLRDLPGTAAHPHRLEGPCTSILFPTLPSGHWMHLNCLCMAQAWLHIWINKVSLKSGWQNSNHDQMLHGNGGKFRFQKILSDSPTKWQHRQQNPKACLCQKRSLVKPSDLKAKHFLRNNKGPIPTALNIRFCCPSRCCVLPMCEDGLLGCQRNAEYSQMLKHSPKTWS